MQNTNKKRAFTLVELMIVISIITVLITAILLSFGSMDDTAQADTILANLQVLRSASSANFAEADKQYRDDIAKPYWRNSHENRPGYQPLLFPEDPRNPNAKKAEENARLIDLPITKYALYGHWDFSKVVPGHGIDPHSDREDCYFIGIRTDPNITIKAAEIVLMTKGMIWEIVDPSYYVGKPYSVPSDYVGYPGGKDFGDPNSETRQVWKRDIIDNPNNLMRLVFFSRIPID